MDDHAGPAPRRHGRLRAAAVVAGVAVALAGCSSLASPDQLDARFVAGVQAGGHAAPSGAAGAATLVTAARKVCERRANHATVQERRRWALTRDELAAVTQAFAGDARRFATLAVETYCP